MLNDKVALSSYLVHSSLVDSLGLPTLPGSQLPILGRNLLLILNLPKTQCNLDLHCVFLDFFFF